MTGVWWAGGRGGGHAGEVSPAWVPTDGGRPGCGLLPSRVFLLEREEIRKDLVSSLPHLVLVWGKFSGGAQNVAERRRMGDGGGGVDWCWAQTFEVDPEAFGVGVSGAHVT